MKTLFVSGTRRHTRPYFDVATRCRCYSLAGELNKTAHRAMAISQEEFERHMPQLENFESYVFHRPSISISLQNFINKFKNSKRLIADFDDLLFDPSIARQISTVKKNRFLLEGTLVQVSAIADAACLFDEFSLSTQPLKDHIEKMFPQCRAFVIPNGLPSGFIGLCDVARKKNLWAERKYLFGYVAGTLTHDRDLAMIKGLLLEKLRAAGKRMLVVGPVCEQDADFGDKKLVTRQNLMPFSMMPQFLSQCQYMLAPLENNIFNQAKSCIKFLEGAACGCVVLATPIPDIDRFESPLLIKCRTQDDWEKVIGQAGCCQSAIEKDLTGLDSYISARQSAMMFKEIFLGK